MLNINRVEVMGNLTKDPELRFTPSNQAVASFAIATNRRYRDQSGTWIDSPPEYHDVVVWGQLGERCNQILHKGDRILAIGRLQTRSWEAQDGSKRYRTELVAETIVGPDQINKNLGGENSGGGGSFGGNFTGDPIADMKASAPKKPAQPSDDEINIDDIPF